MNKVDFILEKEIGRRQEKRNLRGKITFLRN